MEHAAPQKRIGQLALAVAGDDDDRPLGRLVAQSKLRDVKLHPVDLVEEIVGEIARRLVDLVDQHHPTGRRLDRLAERVPLQIHLGPRRPLVAYLRVVEAQHVIDLVEDVARLMIAARVELEHRSEAELAGHRPGEGGLAGAGIAGDEQRLFDDERGVDGRDELRIGEVAAFFSSRVGRGSVWIDSVTAVPHVAPSWRRHWLPAISRQYSSMVWNISFGTCGPLAS